jgi:hypothetical protein
MKRIFAFGFAAIALLCFNPHASAVTLYGAAYVGTNTQATLYTIDSTTGTETLVGLTGYNQVSGIDFDPITGTLYGVGYKSYNDIGFFELITINITTGVGTTVGGTGTSAFQDISFRSDGTLFGFSGGSLYTLNLITGAATLVGSTGLSTGSGSGNATAFNLSDVLYNINQDDISTLNQTNGAATDTGVDVDYPIEIGTNPRANAMDYDLLSGILYASVVHGGGESGLPVNFIAQIDLVTGDVSNVHSTILGLDALAVFQQPGGNATSVPEGMSTLWLALPLCGLLAVHRRIRRVA